MRWQWLDFTQCRHMIFAPAATQLSVCSCDIIYMKIQCHWDKLHGVCDSGTIRVAYVRPQCEQVGLRAAKDVTSKHPDSGLVQQQQQV